MEGALTQEASAYLKEIYSNPKHASAFSSPQQLYRYVKRDGKFRLNLKVINKWLQSQEVYTTNRKITRKIRRRRVIAPYIDFMWDIEKCQFHSVLLSQYHGQESCLRLFCYSSGSAGQREQHFQVFLCLENL